MSAELRALAEKATPGPWSAGNVPATANGVWAEGYTTGPDEDGIPSNLVAWCHSDWRDEADAAYIAAASPDVILALLDERDAAIRRASDAEDKFVAFVDEVLDLTLAAGGEKYRERVTALRAELRAALRSQESQKPPETDAERFDNLIEQDKYDYIASISEPPETEKR